MEEVEGWCEGRYSLVEIIPDLPGRGEGQFAKCIRMSPENDLTNGFFVACFQRTSVCDDRGSKRAVTKLTHIGTGCNDVSRAGKQTVSKKRHVSDVAEDTSAKKKKKKSKSRRNGRSVTAEA